MEPESIEQKIEAIEAAMQSPTFWANKAEAQRLVRELQDLKARAEGGGQYDKSSAIVSIVAGAGGDDAEDFAAMLLSMYQKYAESRGWGRQVTDIQAMPPAAPRHADQTLAAVSRP